jgi:hypothetical protein
MDIQNYKPLINKHYKIYKNEKITNIDINEINILYVNCIINVEYFPQENVIFDNCTIAYAIKCNGNVYLKDTKIKSIVASGIISYLE